MTTTNYTVSVTLFDRPYSFKCAPDKKEQLLASVNYLESEMQKIKQSSQINNIERLSILAALNIANELLMLKNQNPVPAEIISEKIYSIQERINTFLQMKEEFVL